MSSLIDYLNKVEKDVEKWPSWKHKSLKEAFQIPKKNHAERFFSYIPYPNSSLINIIR